MLGIVINALFSNSQFGGGGEWFPGTWIANKAWMGAAGDLEAYALTTAKAIGGGPDVNLYVQAAVCFWSYTVGSQADDAVAQVDGLTGWLYDAQTGEEVGVLQAGANIEISCDGTDDFHVVIEYRAGVDQYISTRLQFTVVFCSHMIS